MLQSIQKLLEKTSATVEAHPVSCGFAAGLIVAFVVLLLLFLLFLILRSRKLRCIEISSEDGMLRLNARAVQDAVRAVAESFPAFSVRKVDLRGSQTELRLAVAMDFLGDNVGGASVLILPLSPLHLCFISTFPNFCDVVKEPTERGEGEKVPTKSKEMHSTEPEQVISKKTYCH